MLFFQAMESNNNSLYDIPTNQYDDYPLPHIPLNQSLDDSPIVDDTVSNDDIEVVTSIGLCFDTVNDVKTFYRKYIIPKGFEIRTRSLKKNTNNQLRYLMLVRTRVGLVSHIPTEVSKKPTRSIQCGTHITSGKRDDKWFIMSVNN